MLHIWFKDIIYSHLRLKGFSRLFLLFQFNFLTSMQSVSAVIFDVVSTFFLFWAIRNFYFLIMVFTNSTSNCLMVYEVVICTLYTKVSYFSIC